MGDKFLELETERKLATLLKNVEDADSLEASGVVVRGRDILVVMDCMKGIARLIGQNKKRPLGRGGIIGPQKKAQGFEAITRDPKTGRLYLMIEALEHDDCYQGKVMELNADLMPVCTNWLDFDFSSDSKGFEGAAVVRHKGDLLLLALCEGNCCEGGYKGREAGNGRIQVFKRKKESWAHVGTIELPEEVAFEDYADIAIRGKRLAIVSQANSALWVGKLKLKSMEIKGKGKVYRFPLDQNDQCVYCNVEGVDWLTRKRIIAVSDRMKADDQDERCARKDRSIHIMKIPR